MAPTLICPEGYEYVVYKHDNDGDGSHSSDASEEAVVGGKESYICGNALGPHGEMTLLNHDYTISTGYLFKSSRFPNDRIIAVPEDSEDEDMHKILRSRTNEGKMCLTGTFYKGPSEGEIIVYVKKIKLTSN